jgi:Cdc6-like AAA superfamily ATPase
MTDPETAMDTDLAITEAVRVFEREIGATGVKTDVTSAGNLSFLKFVVGREGPIYSRALRETQKALSSSNQFRGALGLIYRPTQRFPESLEANALLTLLTRSTRAVSPDTSERGFSVPYVPFQNHEDHQLAQPATHVVVGRRGVGKSTLIRRAVEILRASQALVAVVDVQAYSALTGDELAREIFQDVLSALVDDASNRGGQAIPNAAAIKDIAADLASGRISPAAAVPRVRRELQSITKAKGSDAFVFLDDFHLIDQNEQPKLLHLMHGALKGANGWLKVAGLRSLLNYYSAKTREGLQVPGDAQIISLDLTLQNPAAAESHLRAILEGFLKAVGYGLPACIPDVAFRRLAWANAGVPRDFLQMFARALEHARRNKHSVVTLSDVNMAIGEFGQTKMDELAQDARNSEGELRTLISALAKYCLDEHSTNAFLLRSDQSDERSLVHTLSDLRLVHLISQSTTPDKAGERYEAYILDYSLFTGFRRRQNIKEMLPQGEQFKASELRSLPKVAAGFLAEKSGT